MLLAIESISKSYGSKSALDGVDFSLSPGVYGLIGPNGAGKTTLLNIIVGNLRPDAGRVLYREREIMSLGAEYRKALGYMPQQQTLYADFTAERFLYYIAALRGLKKREADPKVEYVAHELELTAHLRKRIGAMSGGMKQRLLIAQAILAEPEILVLDEPTAGLDPNQRIAVRNLIGRLAGERIIIISTHIVSDVEFIANAFIMLKDGKVLISSDRKSLVSRLEGKVYEIELPADEVDTAVSHLSVSNIIKDGKTAYLRVISDSPPPYPATPQRANLDDVCLLYFGGHL